MEDILFSRGGYDHKITHIEGDADYVAWVKPQKYPESQWLPWLAITRNIPESNVQHVVEQEITHVERS